MEVGAYEKIGGYKSHRSTMRAEHLADGLTKAMRTANESIQQTMFTMTMDAGCQPNAMPGSP